MSLVYDLRELADLLKFPSTVALSRTMARMDACGFPRPLPGMGNRWSAAQVTDWIAANGASRPLPPAAAPTGPQLVIDNASQRLTLKYVRHHHG